MRGSVLISWTGPNTSRKFSFRKSFFTAIVLHDTIEGPYDDSHPFPHPYKELLEPNVHVRGEQLHMMLDEIFAEVLPNNLMPLLPSRLQLLRDRGLFPPRHAAPLGV